MNTPIHLVANDLAKVVAKRIARLSQTDPVSAAKDYQQHVSAMSAEQKRVFARYVATFAAELERHS